MFGFLKASLVASSEFDTDRNCLGAGTGCGWCRPTLEKLWEQVSSGQEPELDVSPEAYAEQRRQYRKTGRRAEAADDDSGQ